MPAPTKIGITIDCPDPDQVAAFWERFLGYVRRPDRPGGAGPLHIHHREDEGWYVLDGNMTTFYVPIRCLG